MIKLDNIIAVSGQSTLFKLVANRGGGLILEDLENGKSNFFSGRTHQFSPLESMGIYTLQDTIPLKDVYERFSKEAEVPVHTKTDPELKSFFEKTIPEYDRYKVFPKDMKKCVKWYHQLKQFKLIEIDTADTTNSAEEIQDEK